MRVAHVFGCCNVHWPSLGVFCTRSKVDGDFNEIFMWSFVLMHSTHIKRERENP